MEYLCNVIIAILAISFLLGRLFAFLNTPVMFANSLVPKPVELHEHAKVKTIIRKTLAREIAKQRKP
jgi:hypothetical protein